MALTIKDQIYAVNFHQHFGARCKLGQNATIQLEWRLPKRGVDTPVFEFVFVFACVIVIVLVETYIILISFVPGFGSEQRRR